MHKLAFGIFICFGSEGCFHQVFWRALAVIEVLVAAAQALAEQQGGTRSQQLSCTRVAAALAPALAEQQGGARSPSSRTPVAAGAASAGPAAPAGVSVDCLDPPPDWTVASHSLVSLALVSLAV